MRLAEQVREEAHRRKVEIGSYAKLLAEARAKVYGAEHLSNTPATIGE
jgi:hypothetical protein